MWTPTQKTQLIKNKSIIKSVNFFDGIHSSFKNIFTNNLILKTLDFHRIDKHT